MVRTETNIDVVLAKKGIRKDKELAEKMNITPASLSARLNGKISIGTFERIAIALDCDLLDLLKGHEE